MKLGEIVLVKFPFTNLETSKVRPALILARTKLGRKIDLMTIAMITSRIEGMKLPADYRIKDWEKANLLLPSLVRLAKIATVESELGSKILGHLSTEDTKGVRKAFRNQFSAWT